MQSKVCGIDSKIWLTLLAFDFAWKIIFILHWYSAVMLGWYIAVQHPSLLTNKIISNLFFFKIPFWFWTDPENNKKDGSQGAADERRGWAEAFKDCARAAVHFGQVGWRWSAQWLETRIKWSTGTDRGGTDNAGWILQASLPWKGHEHEVSL